MSVSYCATNLSWAKGHFDSSPSVLCLIQMLHFFPLWSNPCICTCPVLCFQHQQLHPCLCPRHCPFRFLIHKCLFVLQHMHLSFGIAGCSSGNSETLIIRGKLPLCFLQKRLMRKSFQSILTAFTRAEQFHECKPEVLTELKQVCDVEVNHVVTDLMTQERNFKGVALCYSKFPVDTTRSCFWMLNSF